MPMSHYSGADSDPPTAPDATDAPPPRAESDEQRTKEEKDDDAATRNADGRA
jgi:hypothetical protein